MAKKTIFHRFIAFGGTLRETFFEFFKEKSFIHCAALSYYTVLTLVPILYLSFVIFGKFIGQKTMVEIIGNLLKENIGIEDISGIMTFINDVNFEQGNLFMEIVGIITLLFSSSALFNALRVCINEYMDIDKSFDTKRKKIMADIRSRLTSVIMLTVFGLLMVITYFSQTILISFGSKLFSNLDFLMWFFYQLAQHGLAIFTNTIIFFLIFKYLHDAKVNSKVALAGSIFTSVLLYLGQLLIKFYITNYFFARDGGLAGTILVILVWMYYSSHIIFLGAKFTSVYGKRTGRAIQIG